VSGLTGLKRAEKCTFIAPLIVAVGGCAAGRWACGGLSLCRWRGCARAVHPGTGMGRGLRGGLCSPACRRAQGPCTGVMASGCRGQVLRLIGGARLRLALSLVLSLLRAAAAAGPPTSPAQPGALAGRLSRSTGREIVTAWSGFMARMPCVIGGAYDRRPALPPVIQCAVSRLVVLSRQPDSRAACWARSCKES
jgi:hypothetical protein